MTRRHLCNFVAEPLGRFAFGINARNVPEAEAGVDPNLSLQGVESAYMPPLQRSQARPATAVDVKTLGIMTSISQHFDTRPAFDKNLAAMVRARPAFEFGS